MSPPFAEVLGRHPVIAILRGVRPDEVVAIVDALLAEGIRIVEVPLNSPSPLQSIEAVVRAFGSDVVTGAGTVLDAQSVDAVAAAGGRIVVAPNCNPRVIERALALGLAALPGTATPTEAFAAIDAGARFLKLFPADTLGPATLKAWRSVLPGEVALIPVGGVTPGNLAEFRAAGAAAFGIGSALYRAGDTPEIVRVRARAFVEADLASRG
jgi:2-dehydro-3-deoxyphosphogalactonate aldolase